MVHQRVQEGVFPAYAGMIPVVTNVSKSIGCVPRIRGDDPIVENKPPKHETCSPHTRG